jgi:hypothetical protein
MPGLLPDLARDSSTLAFIVPAGRALVVYLLLAGCLFAELGCRQV